MNVENVENAGDHYVITFDGGKSHCVPITMSLAEIKKVLLEISETFANEENEAILALKGTEITKGI